MAAHRTESLTLHHHEGAQHETRTRHRPQDRAHRCQRLVQDHRSRAPEADRSGMASEAGRQITEHGPAPPWKSYARPSTFTPTYQEKIMQTIPETTTTVNFDAALRLGAAQATCRYAGEAARIDRGLVLALNGHVTLQPDGTALVTSAKDTEIVYTVNGHCDCPDA